jgi:predicted AlkP superfamily pyrophosphatase or phosphodiesterase
LNQLPELKVLNLAGKRMNIARVGYPQDNIATLATLVTGQTPSVHGIVNKEWFSSNGAMKAYRSKALPQSASFVDIVSQAFEGKSLTVSGSADYQMAAALGAHQYLRAQNPSWNNYASSWSMDVCLH